MRSKKVPKLGRAAEAEAPAATATPVRCWIDDGMVHCGPGVAAPLPALVQNGRIVAFAVRDDAGGLRFPLPPVLFGAPLEVIDTATGMGIGAAPIRLPAAADIAWLGWRFDGQHFAGSFRLQPDASLAAPPALPIEAYGAGHLMLRCFAHPGEDGAYSFRGKLRRLLSPGSILTLRPHVAGFELDQPLRLSDRDIGIIAHLDRHEDAVAGGWAIDLNDRARRVHLDLRLDGAHAATVIAGDLREDLRDLGLSDGRSGFMKPFPAMDRRRPVTVQAYVAGTEIEVPGSPHVIPAMAAVHGYFDAVEGPFAGGWAVNMLDPASPLYVEAVCGGEVVGSGIANLYRGDVENAGMPTAWCGFRFLLDRPLVTLFDRDIHLRVAGTGVEIGGSPRQITQNANIVRFLSRTAAIPPPVLRRLIHRMSRQTEDATLSIVMPVYNTPKAWLIEALNSVLAQWSANWELICIDDASPEPHVRQILDAASLHDPRIHVVHLAENGGIAAATNAGLRLAQGDFVTFMDHDDVIEPDAVHKLLMAARTTGADLIYSDEAITTDDINSIVEVRARPAFSHDYYMSHPYFVHMIAVRTTLAQRLGGWDEQLDISADVDFVLRAIEGAAAVAHVPSVLYRWRTHESSAGHTKMEQVTAAMCGILSRHLARLGRDATVQPGFRYNEYRVDWPDDKGEVLIVIPTRNRVDLLKACIDSIEKTSDGENYRIVVIDHESTDKATVRYLRSIAPRHGVMRYKGIFNYALMNNLAVKAHGNEARHFLFLNNDVEAFEDGWIARLRSLSARPEVGAVGPLLLYGDDRVQHAGVLMGYAGAADHAMKFHAAYLGKGQRHPGYNCNLTSVRDYSAVTAACVMIRAEVFRAVGGFDESFVVGFNDTDLCLRIVKAGYKVLYDGFTVLYHHESATRTQSKSVDHPEDDARLRSRWGHYLSDGDPFYSPLLAPRGTDHTLRLDAGCKGRMKARVVTNYKPAAPELAPAASVRAAVRRQRRISTKA